MAPRTSRDTIDPSSSHYPLNGLDLSFEKYHHRPLTRVDVLANRLMTYYLYGAGPVDLDLEPDKPPNRSYETLRGNPFPEEELARHLGPAIVKDLRVLVLSQASEGGGYTGPPTPPESREELHDLIREHTILAGLRRHVFETSHPELRPWLRFDNCLPRSWVPSQWTPADLSHAGALRPPTDSLKAQYPLRSHGPMMRETRARLGHMQWLVAPPPPVPEIWPALRAWTPKRHRAYLKRDSSAFKGIYDPMEVMATFCGLDPGPDDAWSTTLRTRRSVSEPRRGSHMVLLATSSDNSVRFAFLPPCWPRDEVGFPPAGPSRIVQVPAPRLSEVDHATRRRSLSRRHVARMFHEPSTENGCVPRLPHSLSMRSDDSLARCERCGSWKHRVEACRATADARCKCGPQPLYHTSKACPILCSQPCGNPVPRGKKPHHSAMLCRSRCCMCGIKGHSGRECRLKRCRCGGSHLGQDCGWKPGCRVPGCGRYLCGVHCRECGGVERPFVGWRCRMCREGRGCRADGCARVDCEEHCRECGGEGPFTGQRCGACLGNERPVGERAEEWGEKRRRRGKRGRAKAKGESVTGEGGPVMAPGNAE